MKPIVEYKERNKDWTPLDWSIWGQLYKEENLYSAPTGSRFRFIWTEPSSFLLARRYKKFKVTVHCDFKLNKFMNYKISMQGVDHRDQLSVNDITKGIWLTMFEDYDYNPVRLLIKSPVVSDLKYGTINDSKQQYDESDFTKTQINDVVKVLQALEYLEFVDFFDGDKPLRHMVVKNIYNKYADYQSFWNKYNETDHDKSRESDFVTELKAQADKLKTPLFRNKFLDRSNKKYVGNRGGKLTDEGVQVLFDWVHKTNQSLDLLDSVKYEA
ncbi:MAG: hypothetical protein P8H47_00730 [Candidatus Actinomarina sp.]|nr:hypothetical protein [Candidatus Actinomarina sp.]